MKDKSTLITIIVLLVIFLPLTIFGTYNHFANKENKKEKGTPVNEEQVPFYEDYVYFYLDGELLNSMECIGCGPVMTTINDSEYHTNYYEGSSLELNNVLNQTFGIYEQNGGSVLVNIGPGSPIGSYSAIKTYGITHDNPLLIVENNGLWGVVFLNLSPMIEPSYEYIALPAHISNDLLETEYFIVKDSDTWSIIDNSNEVMVTSNAEITDFNTSYYITYDGTYHIIDYNGTEYLEGLTKDNVYGVGDYLFIISANKLIIYESINNGTIQILDLPVYENICFNKNNEIIDVYIDGNVWESLELSSNV